MIEFKIWIFYQTKYGCCTFKPTSRWKIMILLVSLSSQECNGVFRITWNLLKCSDRIHLQIEEMKFDEFEVVQLVFNVYTSLWKVFVEKKWKESEGWVKIQKITLVEFLSYDTIDYEFGWVFFSWCFFFSFLLCRWWMECWIYRELAEQSWIKIWHCSMDID